MIPHTETFMWGVFSVAILVMLLIDLGIVNRKSHAPSMKEATLWSIIWIGAAFLFSAGIGYVLSPKHATEFLAGYLVEKSLSTDNLFVFIMIFSYFNVKPEHQPRILKWGIIGAIVMRGILIVAGAALVHQFHWMMYVFGGLLLYTVIKMIFLDGETFDPSNNKLLRLLQRFVKVQPHYKGDRFFVRENGVWHATPMLLVVLVIESSDLIFAVDSIPAIFAITTDTFIVFSSNIFAILGLRALYFVLAGMAKNFAYLKPGIIFILFFVAVKMLIIDFVKVPEWLSLAVIGVTLTISIVASLLRKQPAPALQPLPASPAAGRPLKPHLESRNGKPPSRHKHSKTPHLPASANGKKEHPAKPKSEKIPHSRHD